MDAIKQTRRTPSRDLDAELGRRAHMMMWDRRLSIKQLSVRLGVDSTGLSKKLKGERGWALAEIVAIADALDTTVAYLVGEAESPRPGGPDGGSVGSEGFDPPASSVKSRQLAEVLPFVRRVG